MYYLLAHLFMIYTDNLTYSWIWLDTLTIQNIVECSFTISPRTPPCRLRGSPLHSSPRDNDQEQNLRVKIERFLQIE